jgi:hypothetical protein
MALSSEHVRRFFSKFGRHNLKATNCTNFKVQIRKPDWNSDGRQTKAVSDDKVLRYFES